MSKLKVKVLSYSHFSRIETRRAIFDLDFTQDQADGVLCYYQPDSGLLDVIDKPRAWFHIEPSWHSMYRTKAGSLLLKRLRLDERLWYGNPDTAYRVAHPTHNGQLTVMDQEKRNGIVALVSNFGGRGWILNADFRLRNKFITHPLAQLYGSKEGWANWRPLCFLGKKGAPDNYYGEVPGDSWEFNSSVNFLTGFKAVVCLENSSDPYYFSEKFVNAVRANCIPIYHAHTTIKDTVLSGARWIDPADYNFDPEETLNAAQTADRQSFSEINSRWLMKPELANTEQSALWEQVGEIFAVKCAVHHGRNIDDATETSC